MDIDTNISMRKVAGVSLLLLGISGLRSVLFGHWMGPLTVLWCSIYAIFVLLGVAYLGAGFPRQRSGKWQWILGLIGLMLLPVPLVIAVLLYPPGNSPGFGGSAASGAVGRAILLACCFSPIPGICGFLVGAWIDKRSSRDRNRIDEI